MIDEWAELKWVVLISSKTLEMVQVSNHLLNELLKTT